jgi:hypothetical protein
MKQLIRLLLAFLFSLGSVLGGELALSDGKGVPGSSQNVVSISLENDVPVRGMQLQIADSLNYLSADSVWIVDRSNGFDLAYSTNDGDGYLTILLFSTSSMAPGSGDILNLSYSVSKQAQPNSKTNLVFKKALISDNEYNSVNVIQVHGEFEVMGTSGVEHSGKTPVEYNLAQNYPNPFNPTTSISFGLAQSDFTTLTIYNLLGQHIRSLVNNELQSGLYEYKWDGMDDNGFQVSAGIYLYQIVSGDFKETRQLTIVR